LNKLDLLRYSALTEGLSWLALLFIAMPLKYYAAEPIYVKFVGMTHGILFIALFALLLQTFFEERLPQKEAVKIFIASFIPFGTFFTDKSLRELIAEEKSVKVKS